MRSWRLRWIEIGWRFIRRHCRAGQRDHLRDGLLRLRARRPHPRDARGIAARPDLGRIRARGSPTQSVIDGSGFRSRTQGPAAGRGRWNSFRPRKVVVADDRLRHYGGPALSESKVVGTPA